jgi:hypothetical protein
VSAAALRIRLSWNGPKSLRMWTMRVPDDGTRTMSATLVSTEATDEAETNDTMSSSPVAS